MTLELSDPSSGQASPRNWPKMLFSAKFVACRHTGGGQRGGWRQGKETNEVWGCLREECSLPFLAVGLFQLPCSEPAVGCVPSQRPLEGTKSTKARKGLACAK